MLVVVGVWTFLRALFFGSAAIALENLALRHQLLVLHRSDYQPSLHRAHTPVPIKNSIYFVPPELSSSPRSLIR